MSAQRRTTVDGRRGSGGRQGSGGGRQSSGGGRQSAPRPAPAAAAPVEILDDESPVGRRPATTEPKRPATTEPKRAAATQARGAEAAQPSVLATRTASLREYLRDTMAEMRKITWPDQETTRNLTVVVIGISIALGILLGGIDFLLVRLLELF
jgi:preprotein translocase subunit SecE